MRLVRACAAASLLAASGVHADPAIPSPAHSTDPGAAGAAAKGTVCTLDTATSSRWSLVSENGTKWLIDPCGRRFFSVGVNVVDGGAARRRDGAGKIWYSWTAFDPTLASWSQRILRRLDDWGFNSLGGWSLTPPQLKLPQIPDLELGRNAKFHWFDPFDPAVEPRMMEKARELVAPYKGSPWRIGYYPDNEVGWWNGALFMFYQQKPAANFTKQRWVAYLKDRYRGDWARFAGDFAVPEGVGDWNALLASTRSTRLRPGGQGIQAVRGWTGVVAERYYSLVEKALRSADPDALIFGDRLPIYYDPAAVEAEARHVDAVATNYNIDSDDGWIARYFFDGLHALDGGKPVLVSEWFYAATENRTGNLNNGHLMTVATQARRALGAAAATRNLARIPDLIGAHWFEYADYPKGGRADGEDYDFGLVDIDDRPYEDLVAALGPANRAMPGWHAQAAPAGSGAGVPDRQLDRRSIAIPFAEVDTGTRSLKDWPKPASLLPPLIAPAGEVPFGEAYLAWNAQGLALATIGQDYYDLDLLAYRGAFPVSEAYRLDIGIDAGARPRHFTLYFQPPRTATKGFPQMTAFLCAGSIAAATATAADCRPVPGARTSYFGADQPRITAQTTIPWAAIGLDGPPASAQMRVEVAATAWHRSRWMSLSGMAPDEGRTHPKRWLTLRLGRVS